MINRGEVSPRLFNDFFQLIENDNTCVAEHDYFEHAALADVASFEAAKRSYDLRLRSEHADA